MASPKKTRALDGTELTRRLMQSSGSRAPLVVWMIQNYDELRRIFHLTRVNWVTFAEYVTELGFVNARGRPLTPNNVMECWRRTKKAMGVAPRAKKKARPPDQASSPAPAPAPVEPRFKVARAHDEHLWTQQPAVPVPTPPQLPPQEPNPAYAGLSREQIADKILGRKPKEPS